MRNTTRVELRSYNCSVDGEHWATINALSRGKAKSQFLRSNCSDCDIPYEYIQH